MPDDSRREFLRFGLSAFGACRCRGCSGCVPRPPGRSRRADGGDRGLAARRRQPPGHVRPQARRPGRVPRAVRDRSRRGRPACASGELLPRHAKIADRFTILRSVAHTGGGHPAGSLQLLSGDPDAQDKLKPVYPDFMSVAHRLRYDPRRPLPNYVGVNPIVRYDNFTIAGPGLPGRGLRAVRRDRRPERARTSASRTSASPTPREAGRLRGRVDAAQEPRLRSAATSTAPAPSTAMDRFQEQALNLLTSPEAARAFDLNRESREGARPLRPQHLGAATAHGPPAGRGGRGDRHHRADGPLCGRVANWDDHAVNHHVFDALKFRAPFFDQAVTALIEDIYDRGLDRRVLVVVTGEFGRTPRISYVASSGGGVASGATGTVQPGRDHWPRANSMLWAGGGIATGRSSARPTAAARTSSTAASARTTSWRRSTTTSASTTRTVTLPDQTGRPIHIVAERQGDPGTRRVVRAGIIATACVPLLVQLSVSVVRGCLGRG